MDYGSNMKESGALTAATPSSSELVKRLEDVTRRLVHMKQRVHQIADTLWGATPTEVAGMSHDKPSHSTLNAVSTIETIITEITSELERF